MKKLLIVLMFIVSITGLLGCGSDKFVGSWVNVKTDSFFKMGEFYGYPITVLEIRKDGKNYLLQHRNYSYSVEFKRPKLFSGEKQEDKRQYTYTFTESNKRENQNAIPATLEDDQLVVDAMLLKVRYVYLSKEKKLTNNVNESYNHCSDKIFEEVKAKERERLTAAVKQLNPENTIVFIDETKK